MTMYLAKSVSKNGIMIGFGIVLLAITGFFAFKAYRDKKGTKFRELVMILALTLVAMLLVTISKYQTNQASNNQFQTSLHFIEVVSKTWEWINQKFMSILLQPLMERLSR